MSRAGRLVRVLGPRPLLVVALLGLGILLHWDHPVWAAWTWMGGLVAFGIPQVARTFAGMWRGHFAADVVAALAILTAIILWQPFAGLVVVLMQAGGEALERHAEGRASAALDALVAAAPHLAHRRTGAGWADVAAEEVAVGDLLLVRPGELIPCDGEVEEGDGSLDLSRLTGEPIPVRVHPGLVVRSGSGVLDSPVVLRALRPASASEYAKIVQMVREAQASKAPFQRLADRYAIWFTPLTLAVAAAGWIAGGDPDRALAVLVVATPCPMILATPVAIVGGIGRAARRGLIFRRGAGIEAAAGVTAAILDKTGTLTLGRPEVSRIVPIHPFTEHDLLTHAASVERGAGHELARSVEQAALRHGLSVPEATGIRESAGRGVRGEVGGRLVAVGGRKFAMEQLRAGAEGGGWSGDRSDAMLQAWVTFDGRPAGTIEFADRPRLEAGAAIARLRALGIRPLLLLSGDSSAATEALGAVLGLDEARGDQLPGDKLEAVAALRRSGARVLMVGDGVNDAPALSAADLGIALASRGGGISAEAAEAVVLSDDLDAIPAAVSIGRRTMRIARQSLWVGLGLSAIAMLVAAAGAIPPAVGALLQEGIDVAVILNAVRASGEGVRGTQHRG